MTEQDIFPSRPPTFHRTSSGRALHRPDGGVVRYRSRRGRRRWLLVSVPAAFALGVVLSAAVALLAPVAVGGQALVVMSDSMRPTLRAGDVVLAQGIAPDEARIGDVLVFPAPDGSGRMLTHRLRSITIAGDRAFAVTQGDANNVAERWTIPADGHLGRVVAVVPALGRGLVAARSGAGWLLVVAFPAAILALVELRHLARLLRDGS